MSLISVKEAEGTVLPPPVAVEVQTASLDAGAGGSFRQISRRLSLRATDDTMKILLRYNVVEYLYQKSKLFKILFVLVTFLLSFNLALNACLDVNVATARWASPYWYNLAIVHPHNCDPSYYQANNTQYMMGEWLLMADIGLCPQEATTKPGIFSSWTYEKCIAWDDSSTWSAIDANNRAIGISSSFSQGASVDSPQGYALLTASCVFAFFIWFVAYIYSQMLKAVYTPADKVAGNRYIALVLLVFSMIEFGTSQDSYRVYSTIPQYADASAWEVYFPTCDVYTNAGSGLGILKYVAVTSGMLMCYCIIFFINTFWVYIYDAVIAPCSSDAVVNANAQYVAEEVTNTISPIGNDSINKV